MNDVLRKTLIFFIINYMIITVNRGEPFLGGRGPKNVQLSSCPFKEEEKYIMNMTEQRLKTLETEIMNLRLSLEQFMAPNGYHRKKPSKDRSKLLDIFGAWDGDIDLFLNELYDRRERRGRLE